jgi:hypothetical protein
MSSQPLDEAIAPTLEFEPGRPLDNLHTKMVGGGIIGLEPGQWTDDTVAMGRSLVQKMHSTA